MSIQKKDNEPEKIPSSPTGGVAAFPIEGPLGNERYRLAVGMTDEDRAYRRQWLKDQILAESEPIEVPGYYEARFNPIRRAIMWPLNQAFAPLYKKMGEKEAFFIRYMTGKAFMGLWLGMGIYYYFKYNAYDWTSPSGWKVYRSRSRVLPGQPGYGEPSKREPSDYADFGFKDSPI
ncbi:NADH dehydrogenase 1 beta subcomplex subunit 6 [Trinorchestia longiramus]|nr:NADH dehydrogenase 1 beta subcomplex subunit 6 [Trinorchestia longiramus]